MGNQLLRPLLAGSVSSIFTEADLGTAGTGPRRGGAAVVGLGTWAMQARRTGAGWRIIDETLESPMRVVVPKAE